jgi:uncharacterized protein
MPAVIVDVSGLLRKPGSTEKLRVVDSLPPAFKGRERIQVRGPVRASMTLKEAGGNVLVKGDLTADVTLTCGRCLKGFDQTVEQPFEEVFRRHSNFNREDPEEREEEELFAIEEQKIDLTPMLTQALVLAVPFSPLCEQRCRGLCSVCGEDLNATPHAHSADDEDLPQFKAALKHYLEEHPSDKESS